MNSVSKNQDDPYRVLGLSVGASQAEIKKAYRALVRTCHPDACPGDLHAVDRFQAVTEAYRLLVDPVARARYARPSLRPAGFWDSLVQAAGPWPRKGLDLRMTLELAPVKLVAGGKFMITIPRRRRCPACARQPDRSACPDCLGSGLVLQQDRLELIWPPGVGDGSRIRLPGEGDDGLHGGQSGDLYLDVRLRGNASSG